MYSFVYVLVSDPDGRHADCTGVSASFLRNVHPDARIHVLCDPDTRHHLRMSSHPLLGLVDELVVQDASFADAPSRKQFLKSGMREWILGDFVYLDCETLPIAPLDELFRYKEPIALAYDHNQPYPENIPESEHECHVGSGGATPSEGRSLNTGVIFWRNCQEALELGRHYRQALESMRRDGLVFSDGPAIHKALSSWDKDVRILPVRYNAQVHTNPLSGIDASIWQFNGSGGTNGKKTFFDEALEMFTRNGRLDPAFIEKARSSRIHFPTKNKDQEDRLIDVLKEHGWLPRRDLLAITETVPVPACPRSFCTVITSNYLPYALNLLHSIREHDPEVHFNILISDAAKSEFDGKAHDQSTFFRFAEDVASEGVGLKIVQKYRYNHHDAFRWSCKSVLINYLIAECGYAKVIYVDSDMFFFSPFSFLFDALDTHRVLLTPHWRTPHPSCSPSEYRLLFSDGLYNAGFIGANSNAIDVMEWWAESCLYSCQKGSFPGEYVDQSILNMMPIYFEGVHILRHKGCNVSVWNQHVCRRTMKPDGSIFINDVFPVVFIHFVANIAKSFDPLLGGYFDRYLENLRSFSEEAWEREMSSRMARYENDYRDSVEEETVDRGVFHKLMVQFAKPYRKRNEELYWRIKHRVITTYLSLKNWNHAENIALLTQPMAFSHCLGLWLRETPGTVLASRPIADRHWTADILKDEEGQAWEIHQRRRFPENMLSLEALAKARLVDPVHVNWSSWGSLLGIKRMVLNLPLGWMETPGLAQQLAEHCRVVVLLVHPCSYANRKLFEEKNSISEARLREADSLIGRDDALRALTGENPSEWTRWVVRWCMDVYSLMEGQKQGGRIFFVLHEWLEWDTQRALKRLCKSLSLPTPIGLEGRFTEFCRPCNGVRPVMNQLKSEYDWKQSLEQAGHVNIDRILRYFEVDFYQSSRILPSTHLLPMPVSPEAGT